MIFVCILETDCNYNNSLFFIALLASRGRICAPAGARKQSLYSFIFYSKKYALIPYLDNIEITSIKIFLKTTEISGKSGIFFLNGLFSVVGSTLIYDTILSGVKQQERLGVSLGISYLGDVS